MHILFANTGVQLVCIPLKGGSRYQTTQIGYGWQRSQCGRWAKRLPMALALGAGEHIKLPPGNGQLIKVLEPFDK